MNLTEAVKWTDVAQLVATVIGFVFVVFQLRELQRATQGDTHADLYGQYMEMGKLFLRKPHLRPYFYDSAEIDVTAPNSARIKQEVAMMCELITTLLEHAALQRPNLPGESWEECWRAYTYARFDSSSVLREWWLCNQAVYADSFRKVVNGRPPPKNKAAGARDHSASSVAEAVTSEILSHTPQLK
jgi:hypothetical protein